jgi:UPF0755 protein
MTLKKILIFLTAICLALIALFIFWINAPIKIATTSVTVVIKKGTSLKKIISALGQAGIHSSPLLLYTWFRISGQSQQMQLGLYQFTEKDTPRTLLVKLATGESIPLNFILIDGWNFSQIRKSLSAAPYLEHDTNSLSDEQIMAQLGRPGVSAEGQFFPDTYRYASYSSDLYLLRNAMKEMDKQLDAAWLTRDKSIPLTSKEQVRIMASLVEKESGLASDLPMIASVLENRLRIGMRLQTDPSVIYGMGIRYKGKITLADLARDTPWNTYTRANLPPTPIATPGRMALMATVHPAKSRALYFVASGDGRSSVFNDNLRDHNLAVRQYLMNRTHQSQTK